VWLCPAAGVGKQRRVVARAGRAPPRKRSVGVNDSARSLGCRTISHSSPDAFAFHTRHARPVLQPRGRLRTALGYRSPRSARECPPSIPHCEVPWHSECPVPCMPPTVPPMPSFQVSGLVHLSFMLAFLLPCRPRRLMGPPCQPRHAPCAPRRSCGAVQRVVAVQGWSVATATAGPWSPFLAPAFHGLNSGCRHTSLTVLPN